MKLNKSAFIIFIEIVTISLTLLHKTTISFPLTQRNVKHTSQQKHFENSIALKEMYYDNSEYLSYGNEIYDTYNDNNSIYKATNYKEKDSKYSKQASSKKIPYNNYFDEQYSSKRREKQKPNKREETEKELIDSANNIQDQVEISARMEWNTLVVTVVVILIIIVLIAIGCGIFMICKKDNPETGPGYSVAVSNRLFKAFFNSHLHSTIHLEFKFNVLLQSILYNFLCHLFIIFFHSVVINYYLPTYLTKNI